MPNFVGTSANDTLNGGSGDDDISGLAGDDSLQGLDGNDTIYGGSGYDTLVGGLGENVLYGDGDDDLFFGGAGNETQYGGTGNDSLSGAQGNDVLLGEDGNDAIQGGSGDDTLLGGAGSDNLLGGSGLDSLDGGEGNDRVGFETFHDGVLDILLGGNGDDFVYFSNGDSADGGAGDDVGVLMLRNVAGGTGTVVNTANMTIDLSQANMNAVASTLIGGTVQGFERWGVYTGSGNDSLTGSATGDLLHGFTGSDTINGGGGDDTIVHTSGTALLSGGLGNDRYVFGSPVTGEGADTITDYSLTDDYIDFSTDNVIQSVTILDADSDGVADDTAITWRASFASTSAATVNLLNVVVSSTSTAFSDIIYSTDVLLPTPDGFGMRQTANGLAGNDTIIGTENVNTILGGAGNDLLVGNAGYDTIDGGDGDDVIGGGNDQDSLLGGNGNDFMYGGGDADVLVGGIGADFMSGGDGADLYFVDNVGDQVIESFDFGTSDEVFSSITFTLGRYVEALYLTDTANIDGFGNGADNSLSGNDGNNVLSGLDGNDILEDDLGNDTLVGGDGNDNLRGGAGINILDGGTGNDEAYLTGDSQSVFFDLASLATSFTGQIGSNQLISIERILNFGDGNDTLVGTGNGDILYANGGNDFVAVGNGNDVVYGGRGNDIVILGAGEDVGISGDGVIDLFNDPPTTGEVDYIYAGLGNDFLSGSSGGLDILLGQEGNDTINDGRGAFSYLLGGTGNNQMTGQSEVNVFLSEGTLDTMSGNNSAFYYRLADGASSVTGGLGVDQFIGGNALSNDTVNGNDGSDYIFGGNGNDLLSGGAGNDVIIGQNGNDTLEGGAGVNLLWANDAGSDQILVSAGGLPGGSTQVVEFFEAGGTNDVVRLLGSSLSSFAGYEALLANIGNVVGTNLLVNAGSGAQLYLNLGANQTAIWFQGISAYSLTSADFLFV